MKIAVCDDEKICCKCISALLEEYTDCYPELKISFSIYQHADDLVEGVKKNGGFDIYILDIMMPDTDGIELGVQLRQNGYDGKIIYLTAAEEYAIDSFKAQPFNYLLKPIQRNSLFEALDNAVNCIGEKDKKSIIVRTTDESKKITLENILYTELSGRKILYHLKNSDVIESITIRTSFIDAVPELLNDLRFAMCGKSMLINLNHITAVSGDCITFVNGINLYVTRKSAKEIRDIWYDSFIEKQKNNL